MALRSPICAVVGHVDHGKTTLLDSIRSSAVAGQEEGRITQAIGASIIPIDTIKKLCGDAFPKDKITVPGILFIDTPGHAAFTSLRKRGGSLADIAILLVDLHEGFRPQTREAIEILKSYKTPFIVAANKLDLSPGYRKTNDKVVADINSQQEKTNTYIETKLYELVGTLSEYGFPAERFDRVSDFQKNVAIVPISAQSKQGISELLMVILGLAQRFLEAGLSLNAEGPGKGVILEVKEEQGFGTTLDVILYDGQLSVGDQVVIGTLGVPITTKIRALLEPESNTEMRDKKATFKTIKQAHAAIGVKIVAPGIEGAIAGMPIVSASATDAIAQTAVPAVLLEGESQGVIIKADTLGGIEALAMLLKEKNIPIHSAGIGAVSKRDVAEAEAQPDPVIIAFGVTVNTGTDLGNVTLIADKIIYSIIERYEARAKHKAENFVIPILPTKAEILANHIFRQSNPLICGMNVIAGELKTGMLLMKDGKRVASVKEIQDSKKSVSGAVAGKQVAVSLLGPTAGRQCCEKDVLYSEITEEQFRALRTLVNKLTENERQTLKEIASTMRKENPLWGV